MSDIIPSRNTGQFQKGQSGNPSGRPPGARNRATLAAEALLEGEAERLTRVAVERALEGDPVALRLCLERILPVMRGRRVQLDLPEVAAGDDAMEGVAGSLAATVRAMAEGEITPDEAVTISGILDTQRRFIETADLERRLVRLEGAARAEEESAGRRLLPPPVGEDGSAW